MPVKAFHIFRGMGKVRPWSGFPFQLMNFLLGYDEIYITFMGRGIKGHSLRIAFIYLLSTRTHSTRKQKKKLRSC